MKTKPTAVFFLTSILITIVLLVIAFAVAPRVVSMLATQKYGAPRLVCSDGQAVEFPERWTIGMLDLGDARWPLLYGVIPVPRAIAGREAGDFFLHLTSPDGASFAVAPRVPTFDAVQSSADCQKSAYCRSTRLPLVAEHRALVVKLDHGYAATLLDMPLQVSVSGLKPDVPVDVAFRPCVQNSKSPEKLGEASPAAPVQSSGLKADR
jgi:hypothetical protein